MKKPNKPTPTPTTQPISSNRLCSLTGLTDRRHRQLAQEGWFPAPKRGEYDMDATLQGIFRFYREGAAAKSGSARYRDARASREESRARSEAVAADLAEKHAVKLETVGMLIARAARTVRSRLDSIPSKMSVLMENRTISEREIMLRDELDQAYAGFNRLHPKRLRNL